jgi:hypothetical protein
VLIYEKPANKPRTRIRCAWCASVRIASSDSDTRGKAVRPASEATYRANSWHGGKAVARKLAAIHCVWVSR